MNHLREDQLVADITCKKCKRYFVIPKPPLTATQLAAAKLVCPSCQNVMWLVATPNSFIPMDEDTFNQMFEYDPVTGNVFQKGAANA